jgi:hypothetical protein
MFMIHEGDEKRKMKIMDFRIGISEIGMVM